MRQRDDLRHRRDGAQALDTCVTDTSLVRLLSSLLNSSSDDLAAVVDRNHAQGGALFRRQLLPRHDIGVVLEVRDDDLVAAADELAAKGIGDQVDAFGGAAHENDFIGRGGAEEVGHLGARRLIGVAGARGQRMGGAVDVRIFVRIKIRHAIDHGLRLVGGGGIVEPHQGLAVDPFRQHGKIAPHGVHVEWRRCLPAAP